MYKYFPVAQQGVDNDKGHNEKWHLAIEGLKKKNTPPKPTTCFDYYLISILISIFSWRE